MAISGGDGSIILTTKVDESGLSSGLSKLKSGVGAFGKAFAVAGAAGVAAFAGITKAAVDSYAEYEQLKGGVETLFKDSAVTLMKYADQAYKTSGMSANQYMEGVTSFSASMIASVGGDTAKAAELSNQAMISISDNANKMGTDMESIIMTYQSLARGNVGMLDNLKLGYGGTKAELERLIEDAEAYKKSMGEIVDYDASNFADVTQAIQAIQEKLGIAGATAEEASTTIQGSAMAMKAAWENLLTGIVGSNEELDVLMENFTDTVETLFDNVAPAIEKVLSNLPKAITKLSDKFIKLVPNTFGKLIPEVVKGSMTIVQTIADTISANASKIGSGIANVSKIIVVEIANLIPKMIKSGQEIILGFVKGMGAMMPKLTVLTTAIAATFASLQVSKIVSGVVAGFRSIMVVLNSYQAAVAASQHVSILLASTMTPLQLAIGVLTGKVSLATAAQVAWNAVMNMNPVMLAITAVGLLSGAIAGLVLAYDGYLEKNSEIVIATQNIANASQEAAQHTQELSNSLKSITDNAAENITNLEAEAYANRMLADELYNLADKATLTANEKQRMQVIVGELNSAIPDLNLALNSETGQLNLTREAVQDLISQKLELAKANAMQQLYTEQLKAQYKAEADAIENARKLKEAQDEYSEILSQGTVVMGRYSDTSNSTTRYTREQKIAMDNLKEAISNYSSALKTSQSSVQTSQQKMQNIATAAGTELPQSFQTAQQSSQGFFDALLQQTETASSQSVSKGNDFGQGYVNGINAKQTEAYQAGYNLGLQALKGTQDAQRSESPAKETIELGTYYGDGYVIGIDKKQKEARNSGIELAKAALNGTIQTIKRTKQIIINSFKYLISDTRTEVQKVLDDMNEEMLDSERFYAEESLRIEREKAEKEHQEKLKNAKNAKERQKIENERQEKLQEEANKAYLDGLKETAEKERKIFEARKKDVENLKETIVNAYSDMVSEAFDSISELQKTQESFAEKLAGYGGLTYKKTYKNKYGKKVTENWLSDLSDQNEFLEEYYDMLMKVKDRGNVPKEFFSVIRDMRLEEGLEYANSLLELSDEDFAKYISEWERKQETAKHISKALYEDEATELATSINDEFDSFKDDMFGIGKDSAGEFGDGFIQQLKFLVRDIQYILQDALGGVTIGGIGPVISGGVGVIKVPALARGGIAPRKMLAMIGERGREAVLPLENNTGWMDALADRISTRMSGASSTVVLEVDGREFGRAVVEQGNRENRRIGTRLVSR